MRLYIVAVIVCAATLTAASDAHAENSKTKQDSSQSKFGFNVEDVSNDGERQDEAILAKIIAEDRRDNDDGSNEEKAPTQFVNQIVQPYLLQGILSKETEPIVYDIGPITSEFERTSDVPKIYSSRRVTCTSGCKSVRKQKKNEDDGDNDEESTEFEATEEYFLRQAQNFGQRVRPFSSKTRSFPREFYYHSSDRPLSSTRLEDPKRYNSFYRKERFYRIEESPAQFERLSNSNDGYEETKEDVLTLDELNRILNATFASQETLKNPLETEKNMNNENYNEKVRNDLKERVETLRKDSTVSDTITVHRINDSKIRLINEQINEIKNPRKTDNDTSVVDSENSISENKQNSFEISSSKSFGPIVVPDLPLFKKSSDVTTTIRHAKDDLLPNVKSDYLKESTRLIDSTESTPISKNKNQITAEDQTEIKSIDFKTNKDNNQLDQFANSMIILNPLRVGIALVNEEESNLTNNEFPQNDKSNDAVQSENSELVEINSPASSVVETQKSVEIYHNAPVQEIHFPVELIPHASPLKQIYENNTLLAPYTTVLYEDLPSSHQLNGQLTVRNNNNYNGHKENIINEENVATGHSDNGKSDVTTANFVETTNVQRYPSVLVNVDAQNYVSSTERNNIDDYNPARDRYLPEDIPNIRLNQQYFINQQNNRAQNNRIIGNGGVILRQEPARSFVKPHFFKTEGNFDYNGHQEIQTSQITPELKKEIQIDNQRRIKIPVRNNANNNLNNYQPLNNNYQPLISQGHQVEKIVEKTGHLPHPVEVEKLIERRVPLTVEKVIEKQMRIPEPYLMFVQIPVDRIVEKQVRVPHPYPYPIHVEKVIEKKIPYVVQRVVQSPLQYPVHYKIPQSYAIPGEKIVDKKIHLSHPVEIEKNIDRQRPYSTDIIGQNKFSINPSHSYLNFQDSRAFSSQTNPYKVLPNYGTNVDLQGQYNSNFSTSYSKPRFESIDGNSRMNGINGNKEFIFLQNVRQNSGTKKFAPRSVHSHVSGSPFPLANDVNLLHRRQNYPKDGEETVKDSNRQNSLGIPTKLELATGPTQSTGTTVKRPRHLNYFRQSKMEYGFKPPMVPSIQYDEKTATKVDH